MKHRIVLLTLTCGVFVCLTDSSFAQRHGVPIQVDYEKPARTWEEAAARSQVTAVVRLTGRKYVTESLGSSQILTTVYEAQVLEVIRNAGPQSVTPVIEIRRAGGVINKPDGPVSIEEAGFPKWNVGTKLLVFLSWNQERRTFATVGGPNSAFEDAEGRVRTFGKGPLAAKHNRLPFDEFLTEIKEKVR